VEAVPLLRLPTDTRPVAEALELRLDPRQETYSGAVDIDVTLDAARATLWLHGKGLNVARATVTPEGGAPLDATWQDRHDSGVASLTVARAIPPGRARIHVEYGAAFNRGQHGLYRAREADVDYVFTQFEAIAAREAFPCFDEPAFKIPFTTTLVVPDGQVAIANTHEASRAAAPAGWTRVAFAPSLPLPSYLVAFAVGPFDLVPAPDVPPNEVRARPLPLRAVTARGRARDVAYALAHAGEILATLERYVGLEYPYDKLDLVAVPGKGSAMENPGCVTFDETRLLMDGATASVSQRRSYAGVMAHELAHQWTGDLVTMEWWNDVWLNEAFATWLGTKATDAWDPKSHAGMALLRSAQDAMSVDSLVSARSIRQPITSTHDIANAFDAITYRKGGAVLGMFERWVGEAAWQKGLHAYLSAHRFGSGTADDFLQAENDATGKDVRTAFHTFLDQPGVPFVEARVACDQGSARVALRQSRFLPVGSTGDADATWQIPVCVRTGEGTTCTLLASTTGELALPGACPAFVFPNADAAGYYRFSLAAADLDRLRRNGIPTLSEREKLAYGASLRAAWARATTPMQDVMRAAEPLAADAEPAVAEQPMGYVTAAREWLWSAPARANVEVYARSLYEPVARRLGWEPKAGEDDEARALRGSVLTFLALTARDAPVRAEARKRGLAYLGVGRDGALHADAVDANLAAVAVAVVGEEADRATWDAMRALFAKTVDEVVRGRLLRGMSLASDPTLASAARELMLDPTLRDSETLTPLFVQLGRAETRDVAWAWMKEHYDAILARMPRHHGGTQLVGAVSVFCDEEHAGDIERFFAPKAEALEGGPRALASTLEEVRLCAARRKAQEPSARAMFARQVTLRRATSF
jgi:alanyl aminopeptidase